MANPKLDKKVKAFLDSYLKGTDKNSAEYQHAIMLILRGALTDANFHSEARQLDKFFPKAKSSKYVGTDMETVIEDKGIDIAKAAKWDGYEIIDAFVAYTKNNKLDSLKEAFYSDFVSEFLKEVTHSHEYEDMSQMGEDENDPQEISVGNYQTKYFHVCPGASKLYGDIESKGVDMDMAERSARLQDALYFVEEHIQRDGYKPERDYVMVAKNIAKNIMKMAKLMGLEKEHDYIQGHVDTIEKVVKEKGLEERVMKLTEENVPTDPSKWSYYKSQAKKKFDVYPSAYANAWAAKQYKDAGGGWRTKKSEATSTEEDEFHKKLDKLVHSTFGKSSDEKKNESVNEGMVEPRRGHKYYQLIKDAPVKYIESQSNPTGATGVLLHNKDGYLKGKKGAYVIDYYDEHFYVDLKSKFATPIYELRDQRELVKYIQPVGMAPEYNDWKKYVRDIPFTNESVNEAYVIFYAKKKGDKPSQAAYRDKDMAVKFEKDLKKDGYITMMVNKKIKGVDESVNEGRVEKEVLQKISKFETLLGYITNDDQYKPLVSKVKKEIDKLKKQIKKNESVNEGVEPQIKKIAYYTGTRPEAVEDFVSKHGLNITKLLKFVEKGKLPERMAIVSALAGRPGNPVQKKIIKQFSESINEDYYKSASDAADAARKYAEKKGFEIDEDDWQTQIAMGGKHNRLRPGVGKTHSFSVGLTKNGKPQRKALNISLYGMDSGKFELTTYIN